MAETKKVIAIVNSYNQDAKNGWLVAEGVSPDIFFNLTTLKQKKSQNLNPKKGDKFEVEIQSTSFKSKPSWNILSIKAIIEKVIMQNFSIKLNKGNIFEDNFKIENRMIKNAENFQNVFGTDNRYYQNIVSRHEQNALKITSNQLAYGEKMKFKPDWRLAIGLGGGSVFETSITLHHIYGFPYLPASAIKGVLRGYLVSLIWGNNPDSEAIAFRDSKLMCDIFGSGEETQYVDAQEQKRKMHTFYKNAYDEDYQQFKNDKLKYRYGITEKMGDVIFFDAYPIESPLGKIKADIMNPHYPKYYNGDLPPADWQSPIPIIFLTVEDLTFQFMLGLRKGVANFDMSLGEAPTFKGKILDLLPTLLSMALTDKGIGAKTAVGYGYMQ